MYWSSLDAPLRELPVECLVLTGADDAMAEVAAATSANHRAYAARHGYRFERLLDYPTDCHPSWHKLPCVRERLPHFDAVLWLDADSVVTDPTRSIPERLGGRRGLIVSRDWSAPTREEARAHFSMGNFLVTRDPESLAALDAALACRDEWANRPLWEQSAIQGLYARTPWIRRCIHVLPRRHLNAVPADNGDRPVVEPWQRGDFLCHLTPWSNGERTKRIPALDLEGIRAAVPEFPDADAGEDSLDLRHVACLRELLVRGRWGTVLAAGPGRSRAGVAFRAGVRACRIAEYVACDVDGPADFLADVPTRLDGRPAFEVLAERPVDLVLLDGDLSYATAVRTLRALLRRPPRLVLVAGVAARSVGQRDGSGASYLMHELQAEGWRCRIDCRPRPGERTERGWLAATRDPEVDALVELCFRIACY